MNAECPKPADLERFLAGDLDEPAAEGIGRHLDQCPDCDRVARLLAGIGQAPPADVPGYRLIRLLGAGGMGIVWEAEQVSLGRRVALKLIREGGFRRPDLIARFETETKALSKLSHPNIVAVFDAGVCPAGPYLAMEYLPDGSLEDRLGTAMGPDEVARLVALLARSVHAAHSVGVIHRDLKPANVLFSADQAAKLVDFGIAKLADRSRDHTMSGQVVGSAHYLAPEQAAGRLAVIGPATDVYGLGLILYRLLAGRLPFKADSTFELLNCVVHDRPTPPSRFRPDMPVALERVCLRCLAKDPADRYTSAADLAMALDDALARSPGPGRVRSGWLLAASIALLLLCAAAWSLVGRPHTWSEPGIRPRPRQGGPQDPPPTRGEGEPEGADLPFTPGSEPSPSPSVAPDPIPSMKLGRVELLSSDFLARDVTHAIACDPAGLHTFAGGRSGRGFLWQGDRFDSNRPWDHEDQRGQLACLLTAAFSPSGRYLATGGENVVIRETADGRLVTRLTNLGNAVSSLAILDDHPLSPKGAPLVLAADIRGNIFARSPREFGDAFRIQCNWAGEARARMAADPDGRWMVFSRRLAPHQGQAPPANGDVLGILDFTDDTLLKDGWPRYRVEFPKDYGGPTAVAIAPSGDRFYAAFSSWPVRRIAAYDLGPEGPSLAWAQPLDGNAEMVSELSVGPGGGWIVAASAGVSKGNDLEVLRASDGKRLCGIWAFPGSLPSALAVSADGPRIVVVSEKGILRAYLASIAD